MVNSANFANITPENENENGNSHNHNMLVVDTSSPFRSVKEAIAVYGEQFLARKLVQQQQQPSPKPALEINNTTKVDHSHHAVSNTGGRHDHKDIIVLSSSSCPGREITQDDKDNDQIIHDIDVNYGNGYNDDHDHHRSNADYRHYDTLMTIFRKLEIQLLEAKMEVSSLKQKESENEVTLASLKAELHKCMSKIARLEATEAANTKNALRITSMSKSFESSRDNNTTGEMALQYSSNSGPLEELRIRKDDRHHPKVVTSKELFNQQLQQQPTTTTTTLVSQILSLGDDVCEQYLMNTKKVAKKKPIVPLVTDIFAWKKKSAQPPTHKTADPLSSSRPYNYLYPSTNSIYFG